jgi:hypothetical protein
MSSRQRVAALVRESSQHRRDVIKIIQESPMIMQNHNVVDFGGAWETIQKRYLCEYVTVSFGAASTGPEGVYRSCCADMVGGFPVVSDTTSQLVHFFDMLPDDDWRTLSVLVNHAFKSQLGTGKSPIVKHLKNFMRNIATTASDIQTVNSWSRFSRSQAHNPKMFKMIQMYFEPTENHTRELRLTQCRDGPGALNDIMCIQHVMTPSSPNYALATLVIASISQPEKSYTHIAILALNKKVEKDHVLHYKQSHFLASFSHLALHALHVDNNNPLFTEEIHADEKVVDYDMAKISNSLSFYWGRLSTPQMRDKTQREDIQVGMSVLSLRHLPQNTDVIPVDKLSLASLR